MKNTNNIKRNKIIAIILNIAVVVMAFIGVSTSLKSHGVIMLKYYTEISNILALIAGGIYVIYAITDLIKDTNKIPRWLKIFKYMVTCSLTVTFLVSLFILVPTMKEIGFFNMMFGGTTIYLHTLCPIIAIISYIFFEENEPEGHKDVMLSLTLTIVYAIVSVTLNILKVMKGPYPFLHVYEQPVYMTVLWILIIIGGAYGLAWIIGAANRKIVESRSKK